MSAETNLRADLAAYAPLAALVGTRIAADKVPQNSARPFAVFVRQETEVITTLDGASHGARIKFAVQCWGDTRASAEAVADAVQAALAASTREPYGIPIDDRSAAYDPDLDLEAVNLIFDWWE